ncbi:SET domain-containing protein [Calycina marina]|uniref:SET domain-containing protein n=1 Tax=Calycina marina TaxID=1763456 RepID=A0A9P7ZCI4_9HELO|nr:SET domain-containing protein [Calycina marina]
MMYRTQLPITALPAFCKLADVTFLGAVVRELDGRGFGLVADRTLSSEDTCEVSNLLLVPHDLILSAAFIEEHAKVDHHLRELLDVAGGQTTRGDILLFLLLQITIASPGHDRSVGASNSWTEYVKMLPREVPLPTIWREEERAILAGTSLEAPLAAKLKALHREFDHFRKNTEDVSWCRKCWWEQDILVFTDYLLVDAWYRSRSLELPFSGESLAPCLDMANHSSIANSYYEETADQGLSLVLRPDIKVIAETEITISYGDAKSNAEMLFSYGFIDEVNTCQALTLNLHPLSDDPLGTAKLAAFNNPPLLKLVEVGDTIDWDCPFLYLVCLNDEDGLEFKMQLQVDGSKGPWRVFWQETDVTENLTAFKDLIADHELKDVFELRVAVILQDRIREQLERLYGSEEAVEVLDALSHLQPTRKALALGLRASEIDLLENTYSSLESQKNNLMESPAVLRYLNQMNGSPDDGQLVADSSEDEDFS